MTERTQFTARSPISIPALNQFQKPDRRVTRLGITPGRRDNFWMSHLDLQALDYFPLRGDLVFWRGYRYEIMNVVLPPEAYWHQTGRLAGTRGRVRGAARGRRDAVAGPGHAIAVRAQRLPASMERFNAMVARFNDDVGALVNEGIALRFEGESVRVELIGPRYEGTIVLLKRGTAWFEGCHDIDALKRLRLSADCFVVAIERLVALVLRVAVLFDRGFHAAEQVPEEIFGGNEPRGRRGSPPCS